MFTLHIIGLTFLATDPLYARQGAGSLMMAWGVDQCKKQNVPAYFDSTVEAVPFYEKTEFHLCC